MAHACALLLALAVLVVGERVKPALREAAASNTPLAAIAEKKPPTPVKGKATSAAVPATEQQQGRSTQAPDQKEEAQVKGATSKKSTIPQRKMVEKEVSARPDKKTSQPEASPMRRGGARRLLAATTTTGGTGSPTRDSPDDSTPFRAFLKTTFAGTTATFSESTLAEPACRKSCEDDPNCAAYVMTAAGKCHVNRNGFFTPKLEEGSTMYKKLYRVQTLQQHLYSTPLPVTLKIQNQYDSLCLENPGNYDGRVTTYECDKHRNRQWTLPFSSAYINQRKNLMQIRSMNSTNQRCLEATHQPGGNDLTMVELKACSSSSMHQRWTLLESDQFRNERDGRCLEIDDQKVVTLQPCMKTAATQKWTITTNMPDRLEFIATQIDEKNIGDQRYSFNPHLNTPEGEFKCRDCGEFNPATDGM